MYLRAISYNIAGSLKPGIIDKISAITEFDEILIVRHEAIMDVYTVADRAADEKMRIEAYLCKYLNEKQVKKVAEYEYTSAYVHFIEALLGKNTEHPCDIKNLTRVKDYYNFAIQKNAIGPVLSFIYQKGMELAHKIIDEDEIKQAPISDEEIIIDIARKISEEIADFQLIILGGQKDRIAELLNVLRKHVSSNTLLYDSDFKNTFKLSMDLNAIPLRENQLFSVLQKDSLMINLGMDSGNFFKLAGNVIKENRQNIYIYFNLYNSSHKKDNQNYTNLFIQSSEQIANIKRRHLKKRNTYLETRNSLIKKQGFEFEQWFYSDQKFRFSGIVSKNRQMQTVFDTIRKISRSDINVLIYGDTGTGKELVARAIHQNSARSNGAFVAVNCSAIPETLLEAELFGYEKGAFTGAVNQKTGLVETASSGTLFLDEIGDIPGTIQMKLLRVLQEREIMRIGNPRPISVNVRIIVATNKNLTQLIRQHQFRPDLYYRLNTIQIQLPLLKERVEDIPLLVRHFLEKYNRRHHKNVDNISKEVELKLKNYHWPGNIRELENIIERAVAISVGDIITITDLPEYMQNVEAPSIPLKKDNYNLKKMEASHIRDLLRRENMNYGKVAELLGISRTTLWRRMKEHGLES